MVQHQFVVALRDSQNLVHGLNPGPGERFFVNDRPEYRTQGFAQPENSQEHGVNRLRIAQQQRSELGGAIFRDQSRIYQEGHKLVPGEMMGGRGEIGKIESQAAGDQGEIRVGIGHNRRLR